MKEYTEFAFRREPRKHQFAAWRASKDLAYFALFMDMGTGKTKVLIDTAGYLFEHGKIDSMLVIAPNGVYRNWTDIEIPEDMAEHIPYRMAWYDADGPAADKRKLEALLRDKGKDLRIVAMNIEAINTKNGYDVAHRLLLYSKCLLVIDESTIIKNGKAIRTKACMTLRNLAPYRRIACGNPYANSPLDVFAPCWFLSPKALGYNSIFAFRARFALLKDLKLRRTFVKNGVAMQREQKIKKVVGFKDLDALKQLVAPFSFSVRKSECLDLPPKIMMPPRIFDMLPAQKAVYEEMKQYSLVEIDRQMNLFDNVEPGMSVTAAPTRERTASADIVLTQLMRLQQIACGFIKTDDGVEKDLCASKNPRIAEMLDVILEASGKVIIWAPFTRSINEIIAALTAAYGAETVVRFDGKVTDAGELEAAKRRFQDPADPCRFFVANQVKGARGITLTAAEMVIYYCNTYDNEIREQSEDRAHRLGLTHSVTYVDLSARGSTDPKVLAALHAKKSVADLLREGSWEDLFK